MGIISSTEQETKKEAESYKFFKSQLDRSIEKCFGELSIPFVSHSARLVASLAAEHDPELNDKCHREPYHFRHLKLGHTVFHTYPPPVHPNQTTLPVADYYQVDFYSNNQICFAVADGCGLGKSSYQAAQLATQVFCKSIPGQIERERQLRIGLVNGIDGPFLSDILLESIVKSHRFIRATRDGASMFGGLLFPDRSFDDIQEVLRLSYPAFSVFTENDGLFSSLAREIIANIFQHLSDLDLDSFSTVSKGPKSLVDRLRECVPSSYYLAGVNVGFVRCFLYRTNAEREFDFGADATVLPLVKYLMQDENPECASPLRLEPFCHPKSEVDTTTSGRLGNSFMKWKESDVGNISLAGTRCQKGDLIICLTYGVYDLLGGNREEVLIGLNRIIREELSHCTEEHLIVDVITKRLKREVMGQTRNFRDYASGERQRMSLFNNMKNHLDHCAVVVIKV